MKTDHVTGKDFPLIQTAFDRGQVMPAARAGELVARRRFLAGLLAGAGSLALAACGGGGGGTSTASTSAASTNGTSSSGSGSGTTANTAATTATTATAAAAAGELFYGMNGHMAYTSGIYETLSASAQLAMLKALGVTNYRADVASSDMAQTIATALNGPFKGSGVSILPCITTVDFDQTWSESAAYTYGYDLAASIATVLKGLVGYIECGNELDANGLVSSGAGNSASDYNTSYWPAYRGVIRGMIDGVKSVDSTIKCGVNVGIPLAYTALQMLWNGETPNGSATPTSGASTARWDVTMYHWYETSGDMTRAGQNANINVLQILQESFGVPIWLTEWGFSTADSASSAASYVTSTLNQYYSIRNTYNLQSIMFYQLIDSSSSDGYGLFASDGVTETAAYSAFKSFTAANAV